MTMKCAPLFAFAWLALCSGILDAVPARPLYEPPLPEPPAAPCFFGTEWVGKTYEGMEWIIHLHPDGAVTNIDNGAIHKKSGSWNSRGSALYMELHNKYYEFRGAATADILHGDSSNAGGLRWKTTFRLRLERPELRFAEVQP